VKTNNFFAELKRRNVYKVAVAYAAVGCLLVQVATQIFPFFEIPNWTVRLVLAIVVEFPIARLEIDPVWDPIRNDPALEQLLASQEHVGP